MFGFDNKVPDQTTAAPVDPTGAPALPSDTPSSDSGYPGLPMTPDPVVGTEDQGADEGTMNDDVMTQPVQASAPSAIDQTNDTSSPSVAPEFTPSSPLAVSPSPASNDLSHDELLTIKQNALEQLSPLVGHLEQTPEEKFKTTMMMIQGSDDQSLVPAAYEAANAITDEKVKAQALLDIVNEINYFTQHHQA